MFSRTNSHISRPDSDVLSRTRRGVPLRWQPGPRRRRTEAHCVHRRCCCGGSDRLLSAGQGTVKVTAADGKTLRWRRLRSSGSHGLTLVRPTAADALKARFTFRTSSCEEVHVTPTAPEVWFSFRFSLLSRLRPPPSHSFVPPCFSLSFQHLTPSGCRLWS